MALLTIKEKAEELGISESLLYRLVDLNQIDHYRFGRAIRFDPHVPGKESKNRIEGRVHQWI